MLQFSFHEMCNVSTKVTFPRNGKYVKPIITVFDSDFVVCKNNRHFRGIPRTGCYSIFKNGNFQPNFPKCQKINECPNFPDFNFHFPSTLFYCSFLHTFLYTVLITRGGRLN